jgi:hypothetical protein
MQVALKIAGLLMLVNICMWAGTQQGKEESPKNAQSGPTAGECQPRRGVLADGTLVIRNRDCTTTWVSKEEVLKPPPGQPVNEAAPETTPGSQKLHAIMPQAPPVGIDDPKMKAKYLEAMNGYFDYHTAGYLHRQRVFHWQLVSSNIIFVLVTLLVFSGVYFAALQFHEGMRQRAAANLAAAMGPAAKAEPSGARVADPVTKFSASLKGIEVSSPVLGVIILVISLAFFYLYLVYVYPITELF